MVLILLAAIDAPLVGLLYLLTPAIAGNETVLAFLLINILFYENKL